MNDATPGRHRTEVVEALLAPLEELVALEVTLVLDFQIAFARVGEEARDVDLQRVVDHEIDGDLWVDSRGVTTELQHGVPQRGDVHQSWNASEVLQYNAAGAEGDLLGGHVG